MLVQIALTEQRKRKMFCQFASVPVLRLLLGTETVYTLIRPRPVCVIMGTFEGLVIHIAGSHIRRDSIG